MNMILDPDQCGTMADVRAGVDEVDRQIVALLARRFAFMHAAAAIKADRGAVRDEQRKADVLDKVARAAVDAGLDPQLVQRLYDQLIESSIAYELEQFDRLHAA